MSAEGPERSFGVRKPSLPWSPQKQITPHASAGLLGKLLGLAEGAEALYESQLRSGLKDSRLKPQPPHVYHYNQNSSYIWIALLSRVTAGYRHITKKSTVRFSVFGAAREGLFAPEFAPPKGK